MESIDFIVEVLCLNFGFFCDLSNRFVWGMYV